MSEQYQRDANGNILPCTGKVGEYCDSEYCRPCHYAKPNQPPAFHKLHDDYVLGKLFNI